MSLELRIEMIENMKQAISNLNQIRINTTNLFVRERLDTKIEQAKAALKAF